MLVEMLHAEIKKSAEEKNYTKAIKIIEENEIELKTEWGDTDYNNRLDYYKLLLNNIYRAE
jgi:hypothetical protein